MRDKILQQGRKPRVDISGDVIVIGGDRDDGDVGVATRPVVSR
jgi:hypothetical protein